MESAYEIDGSNFEQDNRYANHPVVQVSWKDAMAYCEWLSRKMGYQISLPTEAQWERAARGSGKAYYRYPWGNEADLNRMNFAETGIGTTSPVGCFPSGKTAIGCMDMIGNVREWCLDWKGAYSSDSTDNPMGPKKGESHIIRGGSWKLDSGQCRSARRVFGTSNFQYGPVGFRLVRLSKRPSSSHNAPCPTGQPRRGCLP